MVSPHLAKAMPSLGTTTIRSAFGERTYDTVERIDIDFLGTTRHTSALVAPTLDNSYQPPFAVTIKLDAPTIFAEAVILDFWLLSVSRPDQRDQDLWLAAPAWFIQDICLIELESRSGPVMALFDTGAGISVLNAAQFAEDALDLRPFFELEIGDATGAKVTQQVALCAGLRIRNSVVPDFHCFSTDLQAVEKALGCDIHMVFGANAMLRSGFRWLIERSSGKVCFTV